MNRVLLISPLNPYCEKVTYGLKYYIKNWCDCLKQIGAKVDLLRVGDGFETYDWETFPPGRVVNPQYPVYFKLDQSETINPLPVGCIDRLKMAIRPYLPRWVRLAYHNIRGNGIKIAPTQLGGSEPSIARASNLPLSFSSSLPPELDKYDVFAFVTASSYSSIFESFTRPKRVMILGRSEAVWNTQHQGGEILISNLKKEADIISRCHAVIHVAPTEQWIFDELVPTVPSSLYLPAYKQGGHEFIENPEYDFVFFGYDHNNNYRGFSEFLRIKERLNRKVKILVAGSMCNKIKSDPENGVYSIGFVEDVGKLYKQAKIALSFAICGDGVKTKVIESLSYGMPVFCNAAGAAGLANTDLPFLHVYSNINDANTWINRVLDSPDYRRELSLAAHQECSRVYAEPNLHKNLRDLFEIGILNN